MFKGAMASMKPSVDAGKVKPFEGDAELVPGIGQLRADGKGYRWLPANYTTK